MNIGRDPRRPGLSEREHRRVHNNYVRDKRQDNRIQGRSGAGWWRPWMIFAGIFALVIVGLIVGIIFDPIQTN
ncbi:MAG: hypothetical protein IIB17_08870 [Chloroflexi bacterium]|nr:hypothetical protein [Chloroflexota bacterium]